MSTNAPTTEAMMLQLAAECARQVVEQLGSGLLIWSDDRTVPNATTVRHTYQLLATGEIKLKELTFKELRDRFDHYRWALEQRAERWCWRSDGPSHMKDLCLFVEVAMNCPRRSLRIRRTYWGYDFHANVMKQMSPSAELKELFDRTIGSTRRPMAAVAS